MFPEPSQSEIEKNRRYFEQRMALYRHYGHNREAAMRHIVAIAQPLIPPALDIGTGKGLTAIALAQARIPVISIDNSPREIHYARLNAAAAHLTELINLQIQDASALGFMDNSFNTVTMVNALHHIEKPDIIFSEVGRVLKDGGKFILADFTQEGFEILNAIHRSEGSTHSVSGQTIDGVLTLLEKMGFNLLIRTEAYQEDIVIFRYH